MTKITLPPQVSAAQASTRVPTPVEISSAFYQVLLEDAADPNTPHVPVHVGGLMREAIKRANRGDFY